MTIKRQFILPLATAFLMAPMTMLTSCGSVFDDLDPCPAGIELRFVYDHNLESANAFPSQVDCLTLYIYDEQGNYVTTRTETTGVLADENYRMAVDLAPGNYRAVAYGGIACDKASFVHTTSAPAAGAKISDLGMTLSDDHIGNLLHDHFHGIVDFRVTGDSPAYNTVTLHMKKTTNNVRVLLQNLNGQPLDGNDFEFRIIDDNTVLDQDNTPVHVGNTVYDAWSKGTVSTASVARDGAVTDVTMAYGEISTSRFHTSMADKARLVVYSKKAAREIINIPLHTYLCFSKSDASNWSDQEFLDRGSQWNLTFVLASNNTWHQVVIQTGPWRVRINNINFD